MKNKEILNALESAAVDIKNLSSNFIDIASGCECGLDGATLKSEIQNRFPLVSWLLGTSMSRSIRRRFNIDYVTKDENGVWRMKVPANIWTEPPANSTEECCWVPFDFAKCCGDVPMNIMCLKDCDSMMDTLVMRDVRMQGTVAGIANSGEKISTINRRINRLSFAFYQAHNLILGMDNTYTDILKPFHGLISVLANPAVVSLQYTSVIDVFARLWCRLAVLGGSGDYVIAVHPLTYGGIASAITKGQNGEYPAGWTVNGNSIQFHGIRFIQDKMVPFDTTTNTGEAWVLDGSSVGAFLASDLLVTSDFIFEGGVDTSANNCGAKCDYYYNYGAAFGNNANRLAVITDIPADGACDGALGDLAGLITPNTLIPNGATA